MCNAHRIMEVPINIEGLQVEMQLSNGALAIKIDTFG
jgi:hypothetical protein